MSKLRALQSEKIAQVQTSVQVPLWDISMFLSTLNDAVCNTHLFKASIAILLHDPMLPILCVKDSLEDQPQAEGTFLLIIKKT